MKAKFYLYACITSIFICFSVQQTSAQCSCTGGAPLDSAKYSFSFDSTTQFITEMTFPKFNPATGNLTCGKISGTFSTVTDIGILNKDVAQQTYQFQFTQFVSVVGPGIFGSQSANATFGPATLQPFGTPGNADSIDFGAQVTFQDKTISANINGGNLVNFLGTGDTIIEFRNTGSTLLQQGSNNYRSTVKTTAVGSFTLAYYWCPNTPLAAGIRNFITALRNSYVMVQWSAQNQTPNTTYELQVGTDAEHFTTVYVQQAQLANGTSTSYQYSYSIEGINADNLYFRIKQVDASGKISYSVISKVSLTGGNQQATVAVYPNPVVTKFSLQFDRPVSGDYTVALVNATGQQVFSRLLQLNNTTLASVNLNSPPPSGLYYLRATDQKTGAVFTNKVFVK